MNFEVEIEKCKAILENAVKGYVGIVEKRDLLRFSIEAAKSSGQFFDKRLLESVRVIQNALYESLVIDIHAWLFDKNENSMSFSHVIDKICRDYFKKKLKTLFSNPPKTQKISGDMENFSWQASWESRRDRDFDDLFLFIEREYKAICVQYKEMSDIRDKLIAHKQNSGRKFYCPESGRISILDPIEASEKMGIILKGLIGIIGRSYYMVLDDVERNSPIRSQVFWQHVFDIADPD